MRFPLIVIGHTLNPKGGITSATRRVGISLAVSQAVQVGLLATLSLIGHRQTGPGVESPPLGSHAGSPSWVWNSDAADSGVPTEDRAEKSADIATGRHPDPMGAASVGVLEGMEDPPTTPVPTSTIFASTGNASDTFGRMVDSMVSESLGAEFESPRKSAAAQRQSLTLQRSPIHDRDRWRDPVLVDALPKLPRAMSRSDALSTTVPAEQSPLAPEHSASTDASSAASNTAPFGSELAGAESIASPRRERNAEPDYPAELLARGIEGLVKIRVEVSANGKATRATIEKPSGHRQFDDAAVAAVRNWQFEPALRNGRPIASTIVVPVRFRIERQSAMPYRTMHHSALNKSRRPIFFPSA